jgi:hypothetical protein
MENSKKKIINKLHESNDKNAMKKVFDTRLKDAEDIVKTSLGSDTPPEDVKNIAARLATESVETNEVNQEVLNKFIKQYGEEKGKQVYYATANKQDRSPETFKNEGEHDSIGRGIEVGMNPEVEADKYEEYRQLMAQLAAEEGGEQPVKEDDTIAPQQTNDPVKLKTDVTKLMSKLDMSSIAPYLEKIDNPTEQAEVIAQFAEKIGVPKGKLSSVISQLRTVAETKMTKKELIESVTGRKIIKTIKVKDIK